MPKRPQVPLLIVAVVVLASAQAGTRAASPVACDVTTPNGIAAGPEGTPARSYGNRQLSLGPFGLWPDGTVVFEPGGAGFITPDGSLGMKFGWQLAIRGPLTIEGHRLDAPSQPLRSEVPNGIAAIGFQPSYIVFPTAGCWEVTGRVGEASLTFVTRVVKVGDGPAWRRESHR